MNSLSWLIYWIGALDSLNGWLAMFCIILTITMVPLFIFAVGKEVATTESESSLTGYARYNDEAVRAKWRTQWWRFGRVVIPLWFLTTLLTIFLPSRQTVLLIAGSEIGEKAFQSDAVQGVINPGMDLLKTWIGQETDKLKAAAAPKK